MTRALVMLTLFLLTTALGQARQQVPPCFPPEAHIGEFNSRWFCGQLEAAGMGRLEGLTAYRLLYLPSFKPGKIVEVRRERSGWTIQTTILGGIGGGPPGGIRERRQRWLTADETLDLEATVQRSGVWDADSRLASTAPDDSTLVIEAVRSGTHRVHVAAAHGLNGQPLRELSELLRVMAGIDDLER